MTLRLAERLGVEPIRALKATGFVTSHVRSRAELTAYGLTATDHAIAEMSRTTRAAEATLRATLLTVFDGGPVTFGNYTAGKPGAVRRLATRNWLHLGTSTCCPDCLRANGNAWQLTWRLPWHTMCTEHGTQMVAICPACRMPFNAGSRRDGTLGPRTSNLPVPTDRCANPLESERRTPYPPLCGDPYVDIPTAACTQPAVVATQTQVDAMLTVEHRNQHYEWWQGLRTVTATLLSHGNPDLILERLPGLPDASKRAVEEHYADRNRVDEERSGIANGGGDYRTASRRRTYWDTPNTPPLIAAILPYALAVLYDLDHIPESLSGDASPLADIAAVDLLDEMVRSRGHNLTTEFRQRAASGTLISRLSTLSRYDPLTRANRGTAASIPTTAIPRLYPWHLYEPVRDILRDTGTTDDYARGYLSICAAKLATGDTWQAAADALGWDRQKARGCANTVTTRLNTAGHLNVIHQHVLNTVGDLPTHINYRHLADQYGRVTEIPADQWDQAAADAGITVRPTAARRRNLAAWQWHHIALMPLNEWPGWQTCANPASAQEVYRRFTREVEASPVRRRIA